MDFHADYVIRRLRERGHEPIRISVKDFHLQDTVNMTMDSEGVGGFLVVDDERVEFSEIGSAWYRRPEPPQLPEELTEDERKFGEFEYNHVIRSLWRVLSNRWGCYWPVPPDQLIEASFKPEQLLRASRFGFKIPRTIITNDPAEAKEFVLSCQDGAIYKPFHGPIPKLVEPSPGDYRSVGVYTSKVTPENIEELSGTLRNSPCLFQEYVNKICEYRVTLIEDDVFVAEIDSQSQPETQVDWRNYTVPMRCTKGELPAEVVEKCKKYVRSYGLGFSALDFIKNEEGDIVFVENNPNGQFIFVERLIPEFRMADKLIDCLINRAYQRVNRAIPA